MRQVKLAWCFVAVWIIGIFVLILNYQSLEHRISEINKITQSVDEFRSSLSLELPYRSNLRQQQQGLLEMIKQQRVELAEHSSWAWLQPDLQQLFFTTDRFIDQGQAYVANELGLSELLQEIQQTRQTYQSHPEIEAYYFQLSSYLFDALFSSSDSQAYKSLDGLFIESNTLADADKTTLQTLLAKTSRVMGSFAQGGYIVERLMNHSVYKEVQKVENQYQAAVERLVIAGATLSIALVSVLITMIHLSARAKTLRSNTQRTQPAMATESDKPDEALVTELPLTEPLINEPTMNESVDVAEQQTLAEPEQVPVSAEPPKAIAAQIDFSVMMDCLGGDRESLCMLLEVFINDHRDDTQQIAALQHDDLGEAIRRAHSLKGVGGNLGAYQLRDVAGRLETALAKNSEQVAPLLVDLEACLAQAIIEAQAFIAADEEVLASTHNSIAS